MPAGPQSRRELDWRALKVLIVDHDDRFRFWARTVFGHKRVAEVLSVAPGSEAIRMLGHTMLDVSLVEASPDGINFVKRLRDKTASPCPGLHVILLINADDETQIRAASEAGIESVIRKSVSEGALLERVAATVLNPRRIVWSESYVGPERRTPLSSTTPGPRRRASDRTEGEMPPRKERPAAAAATPAPAERAVPTQVRGGVRASPGSAERVRQRASAWDEEMEQKVEQDDSESAAPDAAGRAAAEADTAWQKAVTPPEPSPPEPPGLNVARILADHDEWVASRGQKGARAELPGADLTADDLAGASLKRANLGVAKLRHADLSRSDLQAASWRGADLAGADLRGAILVGTDLAGANLLQTEFSGTDLRSTVRLTQAQLARARGDAKTSLPEGLRIAPPDE